MWAAELHAAWVLAPPLRSSLRLFEPWHVFGLLSHSTDEKSKAQRREVTCRSEPSIRDITSQTF